MLSTGMGMGPRGLLHRHGGGEDGKVNGRILLRLLAFVIPYWARIIPAIIMMIATSAGELAIPFLMRIIIDDRILAGDWPGLIRTASLLGSLMVMTHLSAAGQSYILASTGQRVLRDLRARLFKHLQELSIPYHDTNIVGVTISRVINDVAVINNLLAQGVITVLRDSIFLVGTVVIMTRMNARLALLTFSVIPVMVAATAIFTRKAKSAFRHTRQTIAAVVGDLAENIGGMRVIQAFGQEQNTQARFDRRNERNRDAHVRAMTLSFLFLPAVNFLGVVSTCIVLLGGGIMTASGALTIGVVVAFMSYVNRFFMPIRELSQLYTTLQSATAGGERILELLDSEPRVKESENPVSLTNPEGSIEFRAVHFSYLPETEVLHGVSFSANAGETVAIVGPTGAGKTSIINLVCRFYDADSGQVFIDGENIQDVRLSDLHSMTGYVSQDPFLFTGTIAENIAFASKSATIEKVTEAAIAAEAHSFISRLPNGYDTKIVEGGANLSVGQRQLISIARALLPEPRILIMDEATSSVDTLTEVTIQRALEHLLTGRTALIIAHRLSTVRNADKILVIDDGKIVEEGVHDTLMREKGLYADLYGKQFVSSGS